MYALFQSLKIAGWAPSSVFGLHLVLVCGLDAYSAVPGIDIPMHFVGGMAMAYFLWTAFHLAGGAGMLGQPNLLAIAVLAFTSTVATAMFWEFAEYLSDQLVGTFSQPSLEDTLLDMLLGTIGAALVVGAMWFRQASRDGLARE